jgi:excinuclease UvrABC ATPase subunit
MTRQREREEREELSGFASVRGARENNLKDVDVDLPRDKLASNAERRTPTRSSSRRASGRPGRTPT